MEKNSRNIKKMSEPRAVSNQFRYIEVLAQGIEAKVFLSIILLQV